MFADFRKPPVDARRRGVWPELASKQLPEMPQTGRIDADGARPLERGGYKIVEPVRIR